MGPLKLSEEDRRQLKESGKISNADEIAAEYQQLAQTEEEELTTPMSEEQVSDVLGIYGG